MHNFPSQSSRTNNSAQGKGIGGCSQQDANEYPIVNSGAGNYSLQSCVSLAGQNIYIGKVNAAAATLVPFAGETIAGAGGTPTTLVASTIEILQSPLVGSKAADSNWVRLQ